MKSKVDKLNIGKLETTPEDSSKLSNEVKNDVVKKTVHDELVIKFNAIQTTDTSNLVKKSDYNTKINEIEKKITDHDHDKYITTQEINELTSENFVTRLAQANLASKNDIAALVKRSDFDDKLKNLNKNVASNKRKHAEAEKKITDLTNKVTQISGKR